MIWQAGLVLFAYILGSIPFGFLIVKAFYKKDIRQFGSKNPGATNVWRSFGKLSGLSTLALDIAKGALPVWLAQKWAPLSEWVFVLSGLAAIAGHNWSVFLKGKGGKGVATSAGVFLALLPIQFGITIIVFILVLLMTGHVSVGSIMAAITLSLMTFVTSTSPLMKGLVILAGILILVKHIPNMKRLAQGTEPKIKIK